MEDIYGPIKKLSSLRSIVMKKESGKTLPLPPVDSLINASRRIVFPDLELEKSLLNEATKSKAASSPSFNEQQQEEATGPSIEAVGMFDSEEKHDLYFKLLEVARKMKGISQADVTKAVFLFIKEKREEQRVERAREYLCKLEALKDMGFEAEDASRALMKCSLNQEEAVELMLSKN